MTITAVPEKTFALANSATNSNRAVTLVAVTDDNKPVIMFKYPRTEDERVTPFTWEWEGLRAFL